MHRIKMVWLPLHHFRINALRVSEPALLVQRQTLTELGLQWQNTWFLRLRWGAALS